MPASNTRIEHDLLGDFPVPADAYFGIQTARALESGEGILELIREKHILTDAQIDEILNPAALTGQGR